MTAIEQTETDTGAILGSARRSVRTAVHITTVHPWFDGRIYYRSCASLVHRGYDVHLIACERSAPVQQRVEGVCLHTIPAPPNRIARLFVTQFQALQTALSIPADIYQIHDPELSLLAILLRLAGRRVVFDIHEDVPNQLFDKDYIPRPLRRPLSRLAALNDWIIAHLGSDALVTVSAPLFERFPKGTTFLVRNFPQLKAWADQPLCSWPERENAIVYAGTVAKFRGVEALARLAHRLAPAGIKLRIAGVVPQPLDEEMRNVPGWSNIEQLGWLNRQQVWNTLNRARIGIHVPLPTRQLASVYPTKIFEYMAAGLAIVFGDSPVARHFVENYNCGVIVDPADDDAIVAAIRWLIDHPQQAEEMGARGRSAVEAEYNWEHEMDALIRAYDCALDRKAGTI